MNAKRIAALAAGAALLGASLAVADVTFQNAQIINQNGQPVVKIVVGQKAAAVDGIAAANIAAVIGNLAYRSQTITASVAGQATCSVTAGTGAGVCPISNEKVTLEVTLPGTVSGALGFRTLITDWVDKDLENRNNTGTTDKYGGSYPGTGLQVAPLLNQAAKKISGTEFAPLATTSPRDAYAGTTYTEEQALWVQAETKFDDNLNQIVATGPNAAYEIVFTHDAYGIPICTARNTAAGSQGALGDWGDCKSDNDETARHRVSIKFLGSDWLISDMVRPQNDPATNVTTEEYAGGSIKLAKESAYGIVHIGEALNVSGGAYSIKLVDITVPIEQQNIAYASIEIYDANGVKQKEDQIKPGPGGTLTWTAPDGSKLRIHVYKTNPGYTLAAKWAEMAVFSQEIELRDGEELDDDNPDWIVSLYWKNKDYNLGDYTVDSLHRILLKNEAANNALIKLQKGSGFDIVTEPSVWQLSYDGLTLGSADYDSLSFTIVDIAASSPLKVSSGTDCSSTYNVSGSLVYVSGPKDYFTLGSPTQYVGSKFYWVPAGPYNGSVLFQPSGITQCYLNVGDGTQVKYDPGDGGQDLLLANYTDTDISTISIEEDAGNNQYDYINLTLNVSNPDDVFFQPDDEITYTNVFGQVSQEEELFITERGSQFVAIDKNTASFKIAKKVAEAQYYIKTTGAAAGATTTVGPLAEGETASLTGGVTIKVASITETVGACTAAGANCTVDQSGLSAVLSTGGSSVQAVTIFPIELPLVVSDATPVAGTVISVGGPEVNEVTKAALAGSAVQFTPGQRVLGVYGNTIVVAGTTGADTAAAADEFIRALQAQR
ncbi:MAG: S-layer protein [Candidatus Micrarchaeia archaeon]